MRSVIADTSPLPHTALFLGLAEDGLPVLLNLYDPIPGPILIIGDQASGKTSLLQMIARAAELLHTPSEVQSGVITQYPDEWKNFQRQPKQLLEFMPPRRIPHRNYCNPLSHGHITTKAKDNPFCFLIDDLEAITKLDQQTEQNLRWLLLRGPSRRVWPIITINASRAQDMETWLGFFRTRLFGCIRDSHELKFHCR